MSKEEFNKMFVLYESLRDGIQMIAEGHVSLRREMGEMKAELKADIESVSRRLDLVQIDVSVLKKDVSVLKKDVSVALPNEWLLRPICRAA